MMFPHGEMRRRKGLSPGLLAGLCAVASLAGCGSLTGWLVPEANAVVQGTVVSSEPLPDAAEPPRVVVYLDRIDAEGATAVPDGTPTIEHRDHGFWPPMLVVARGQQVHFANDEGGVHHRLFSYSEPNAFDLNVGDAVATLSLAHPGEVRFYCSLHPWERGLIYVVPSPWFDTVELPGSYEIQDVPPGRYKLATWGEATSSSPRIVTLRRGESASFEIPIEDAGEER